MGVPDGVARGHGQPRTDLAGLLRRHDRVVGDVRADGALFSELFGTRVHYSGASLSYGLASILGGSLAPYISARLLASTGASWSIALYIAVVALVSFVAVLLLSETYETDLSETRPEERNLLAGGRSPTGG